ncbi:bactofilin family protein [Hydrogenimonas urashimensis]|uniref:bactofilin family protein n=1 Tax=Hydrogenimonas urashimensis TaxID=2740515 RepID=UPI0019169279|nr:polymer-forming cytoskeletal protein [Hydrogenimonas urashimensis]
MGIFHRTGESYGRTGPTTVIAPATTVTGDIRSAGGVHVDGEVLGNVEAKSYVIVAKGAVIHGEVHAAEVYLGGTVIGDIWALEVDQSDTGVCRGSIEAFKINKDTATQ